MFIKDNLILKFFFLGATNLNMSPVISLSFDNFHIIKVVFNIIRYCGARKAVDHSFEVICSRHLGMFTEVGNSRAYCIEETDYSRIYNF